MGHPALNMLLCAIFLFISMHQGYGQSAIYPPRFQDRWVWPSDEESIGNEYMRMDAAGVPSMNIQNVTPANEFISLVPIFQKSGPETSVAISQITTPMYSPFTELTTVASITQVKQIIQDVWVPANVSTGFIEASTITTPLPLTTILTTNPINTKLVEIATSEKPVPISPLSIQQVVEETRTASSQANFVTALPITKDFNINSFSTPNVLVTIPTSPKSAMPIDIVIPKIFTSITSLPEVYQAGIPHTSSTPVVDITSGPRDSRASLSRLRQALMSSNIGSVFSQASQAKQQLEEKYGAHISGGNSVYSGAGTGGAGASGSYGGGNANFAEGNGNGYGIGTHSYQTGNIHGGRGQEGKGGGGGITSIGSGIGSGIKNFFAKLFSSSSDTQQSNYQRYHLPAPPDSSVLPINPPPVTLKVNADFVELDCIAYGQIQYGLRWVKLVGLNPYGHELFATVADGERILMDTYHYAVRTDGKHSRLIIRNPEPRLHYGVYECQATVAGSPNVVVKEDFVVGRVS